jgi:hypothetical protein
MDGSKKGKKRLGEMLIEEGLISEHQLAAALGQLRQWGGKLGAELVSRNFITEEDLCSVLEKQLGITWLSLRDITISPEAVKTIKHETAKNYSIMPVAVDGPSCTVAIADPKDLEILDTLNFITGKEIKPVIATHSDIRWAIEKYYEGKVSKDARGLQGRKRTAPAKPQKSVLAMKLRSTTTEDALKGIITEEELLARLKKRSTSG